MIDEVGDKKSQAEVQAALAPYLPQPVKVDVLRKTLAAARRIGDVPLQAEALVGLASNLPQSLLGEAQAAVQHIRSEDARAEATVQLATRLAVLGDSQRALAATRKIQDAGRRAQALAGLAPYLPQPSLREDVLQEALEVARALPETGSLRGNPRAETLTWLAIRLAETGHPQEALAVAQEISQERNRAKTLTRLAAHIAELLGETLNVTRQIKSEHYQAQALAELAPHLSEPLLAEALAAAQEIGNIEKQAEALAGLAPYLPEPLLAEALATAQALPSTNLITGSPRAKALAGLFPYLPQSLREEIYEEALAEARKIWGEHGRVEALGRLAPHLPQPLREEVQGEAMAAARKIEYTEHKVELLTRLALYLPEPERGKVLQEALAAGREILEEESQSKTLANVARQLAESGYPEEALATLRDIRGDRRRAEALIGLAPHLPQGLLEEVLAVAQTLSDRGFGKNSPKAEALVGLAPYLPHLLLGEALAAAQEISREDGRSGALAGLAPYLARLSGHQLYRLWVETLSILATRTRQDLLSDLPALEPVIAALGGEEGVAETFHAIQDVGRWWP
jgi:hypothetical protein